MNPAINAARIGVAARDRIVTLAGHVPSLLERALAERVAGEVKGVKAVINQVVVELPGFSQTADEKLATQAYSRLVSNVSVPNERLHLAVKDGAITLHGDVDWPFQLQAAVQDLERLTGDVTSWHERGLAESSVWCVPGVSKVTNKLSVI
jgi:osmotically-inducible protein OsmY